MICHVSECFYYKEGIGNIKKITIMPAVYSILYNEV